MIPPVRPLPLPKSLPDVLTPAYVVALRERLRLHIAWHEACCTDPDDLDTDCLPCTETEDPS